MAVEVGARALSRSARLSHIQAKGFFVRSLLVGWYKVSWQSYYCLSSILERVSYVVVMLQVARERVGF